jgi:ornithine carbamoyltransferase
MTVEENFGGLEGRKLCFVGDGRNNVAVSLMIGCSKMGVDFTVACPGSLRPSEGIVEICRGYASDSGSGIEIVEDPAEAVSGADVIYTDVWASMGEEAKMEERRKILGPYQVNGELMQKTGKAETIFMHCLPAVKGNEVTPDVIDGPQSRAWDEAENRKHTIKALMIATIL